MRREVRPRGRGPQARAASDSLALGQDKLSG